MQTVKEVSKAILQQSASPISNLKLQKLLYYVQGWSLGLYQQAAFNERIEAWVHGPVVPEIFHAYRHFRWNPIDVPTDPVSVPASMQGHIGEVLKVYGSLTAVQLEQLSHDEKPWREARKGLLPRAPSNVVISHELMKNFFSSRANANA